MLLRVCRPMSAARTYADGSGSIKRNCTGVLEHMFDETHDLFSNTYRVSALPPHVWIFNAVITFVNRTRNSLSTRRRHCTTSLGHVK